MNGKSRVDVTGDAALAEAASHNPDFRVDLRGCRVGGVAGQALREGFGDRLTL